MYEVNENTCQCQGTLRMIKTPPHLSRNASKVAYVPPAHEYVIKAQFQTSHPLLPINLICKSLNPDIRTLYNFTLRK